MLFIDAGIAVVAIWLAVIDIRSKRIPNLIVLPAYLAALLLMASLSWSLVATPFLASVISFALFLVLNLVSSGQMGMGDAKLAALLGLGLGALGWGYWLLGVSLGFVFGGVGAFALMIGSRGRLGLKSYFAYGPYLVAGALAAGAAWFLIV